MVYGEMNIYGKKGLFDRLMGMLRCRVGYKVYSTLLYPSEWESSMLKHCDVAIA